ncbi:hypothetical protein SO802_016765 [Lithocarpus litseifolius]|uniref:RNase H type-1 domain-containing protein n=1 Tax=Lithocarpus litseifolius TaxID=425828 RepID=A0AAW2CY39_9ROSI
MVLLQMVALLALVWQFVITGALFWQHQAKFCQLLSLPRLLKLWHCKMHLKRSGNRAAHELARAARIFGVSQVWKAQFQ